MATCATLTTSTRTETLTTSTEFIPTQVPFTITGDPTFETSIITSESCTTNTTVEPSTTSCTDILSTTTITIPGETTETSTTSTITSFHTSISTDFLTSTTCSGTTYRPPTTTTNPPNPDPTDTTTSDTLTTSETTTGTDGIVSTITQTITQGPSPTTQPDGNSSNDSGPNVGAIAGGAIGGFVGLIALAMVLWFFFKKSSATKFDDLFDKHDDALAPHHKHHDKPGPLEAEITGNGYKYGLLGNEVGHTTNSTGPSHGGSGGGSAGGGAGQFNEVGYNPGLNDTAYNPYSNETGYNPNNGNDTGYHGGSDSGSHQNHNRSPSLAPLLGAVGGAAAASTAYAVATSSSRPSTGGSGQPLIGPGTFQKQPQQGHQSHSSVQSYGNHLNTYPPPQTQAYYGAGPSSGGDHTQAPYSAGSGLSPNPSVGSSQWGGSASAYSQQSMPMVPLVAGAAAPGRAAGPHHHPQSSTSAASPFDAAELPRSGSPVSIQEQRVLQVLNPDTGFPASFDSANDSILGGASQPIGQAQPQAPARQMVDGKGRPVDLNGQMVPLVHLDGGAYEEPLVPPRQAAGGSSRPGASGSNEPMPPAYSS